MKATITCTDARKYYHEYYFPFVATCDVELPEIYNGGWNTYYFRNPVEFTLINMPELLKQETANYKFFGAYIQVTTPKGKQITFNYYKSVNKNTGKVETESLRYAKNSK